MLARHLLFLATRRPNKLLVLQPNEPVSSAACAQQPQQPPPYVGPPQIQKMPEPYQVMRDNRSAQEQHNLQPQIRQSVRSNNNNNNKNNNNTVSSNNKLNSAQYPPHHHHHHHHHQQQYHQQQPGSHIHIVDPYQQLIYEKHQPLYSNYADNQRLYAQQLQQHIQGYEKVGPPHQQQFYTLPNRRPQREVILEPPRSITPDITRGLGRAPLSAMHMLARQGQKAGSAEKLVAHHHGQAGHNCQVDLSRRGHEQMDPRCKLAAQQQQRQAPVDVKNRFVSPQGLSALGYRFFASPIQDGLKNVPISPIGPEHSNGFKSSTPTGGGRVAPTVAERLALQSQRCLSPNPALMQHASSEKQLTSSDSGRSTPTNPHLILSPIKSTMSNEELFAAIHKSKKRLNIRDDESLSPAGSVTSLNKSQQVVGTRHSWSPESQKTPEIPKTVVAPSATSRMDFKRLLLQQSVKAGPTRISATEQLKLSRQQLQENPYQPITTPTKPNQQTPLTKVLSPRSAWRFQTPRTDVLSSTIIEDAAAEEKAMKPSPENPSPVSRLPGSTTRRQLDLGSESKGLEELKNVINDTKSQTRALEKQEKELENRLQASAEAEDPIKAIESRRMSNQLARAQFLASSAMQAAGAQKDLFGKRFRARSESPQQHGQRDAQSDAPAVPAISNAVTRSPSAPALETAL